MKINQDIPQGSTLGPLLLKLYVNDLPSALEVLPTLFADDSYLVLADDYLLGLEYKVNSQLQLVDEWLRKRKFTLNLSKTTYLFRSAQSLIYL